MTHPLMDVMIRLDAAVPQQLDRMSKWTLQESFDEAIRCSDMIAHHADQLWHKPKRGQVTPAEVEDAIAAGVAILLRREGGVQIADRHWCIDDTHAHCGAYNEFDFDAVDIDPARRGAHFTPQDLAESVTNMTLGGLTHSPGPVETPKPEEWKPGRGWFPITVADMAVGSGAFLIAAARHFGTVLTDPDHDTCLGVFNECLYGTDINPWSVDLARMAVSLLVPFVPLPGLDKHLRCTDALAGDNDHWPSLFSDVFAGDDPGFDAVIGNPPFLGGQKISGTLGPDYRKRLVKHIAKGTTGSADLSAYFLLRAHDITNSRGQVGLIATKTLLEGATRRVGADRIPATPRYVIHSEPWPGSASVRYCILVTSKAPLQWSDLPPARPLAPPQDTSTTQEQTPAQPTLFGLGEAA